MIEKCTTWSEDELWVYTMIIGATFREKMKVFKIEEQYYLQN